ncbi:ATPase domain-containing protein [Noviherbaspirillum pedocola]|uniref:non-specific serine/threonine protein kinase n=1 Tax=Noviherbaspirillum pedocola TaxID=2801341 RepID=A0A934W4C7_9BURK|nr:ATPase domain-containing protein [Noviherbaspirillum pedocola]MBK4738386.1 recombinase RecA [Noviherbaspirillum pedocola]
MEQAQHDTAPRSSGARLLTTGIPGLDTVLGGGFPARHLFMIQGLAGSGKTTLACQIGFVQAQQGSKVLIVTLIAESHAKLLQHLANFAFFDEGLVGRQVLFFGGYPALAQGGLRELLHFLSTCLDQHKPDVMIIDGFRSVRESRPSDLVLSEFMHSLNALVAAMECTTFLLSPTEGNIAESENTLVDGLVELSQFEDGVRTVREMRVYKARGADHLLGKHAFEVSRTGVVVYPRLEAVATRTNIASTASDRRVAFGIPSWDALTNGGVAHGSITNLVGTPGVGKTIMGLHFIQQALRDDEPCLILGFFESPPRLLHKAKAVGINLDDAMSDGRLEMLWYLPLEMLMDRLAVELFENIDRRKVTRLVIDGVEGFRDVAVHPHRIRLFLIALVNGLRIRNVTTIITQELPYFRESYARSDSSESVLYENMILLKAIEIDGVDHRLISTVKLREGGYDPSRYEMIISDTGIRIGERASALLHSTERSKGVQ